VRDEVPETAEHTIDGICHIHRFVGEDLLVGYLDILAQVSLADDFGGSGQFPEVLGEISGEDPPDDQTDQYRRKRRHEIADHFVIDQMDDSHQIRYNHGREDNYNKSKDELVPDFDSHLSPPIFTLYYTNSP
jgi:hypothetical protein